MKVEVETKIQVNVDPVDVIEELLDRKLPPGRTLIKSENGISHIKWEEEYGPYIHIEVKDITEEEYDYIVALKTVLKCLKK